MLALKRSLLCIQPIRTLLSAHASAELKKLGDQLHPCEFLLEKIERELREDVSIAINQGGHYPVRPVGILHGSTHCIFYNYQATGTVILIDNTPGRRASLRPDFTEVIVCPVQGYLPA